MSRRAKTFLVFCLILLLIWILSSCAATSSYNKIKRNWRKIEKEIAKNPKLADSLPGKIRDTLKTTEIKDRLIYEIVIDSSLVDSLARALCESKKPQEKIIIRERLARSSCPKVQKDTTYKLVVIRGKHKTEIPIQLKIASENGLLSIEIDAKPVNIPVEYDSKTPIFNCPEKPIYKDLWFWVFVAFVVVVVVIKLL